MEKVVGNPMLKAEELRDYELGYRAQLSKRVSLDVSTFRGYYRRLETAEPGSPYFTSTPGPLHEVFPLILNSLAHARTYGGEVFATWNLTNRWRIAPGFTLLHMNILRDSGSQDTSASAVVGDSPKHQFEVRNSLTLRHNLDWDTPVYFVGMLQDGPIPAYTRLDTRLGWRIGEYLELSVAGQNLLRPLHLEFANAFEVDHTEVERSVVGKMTWRF